MKNKVLTLPDPLWIGMNELINGFSMWCLEHSENDNLPNFFTTSGNL